MRPSIRPYASPWRRAVINDSRHVCLLVSASCSIAVDRYVCSPHCCSSTRGRLTCVALLGTSCSLADTPAHPQPLMPGTAWWSGSVAPVWCLITPEWTISQNVTHFYCKYSWCRGVSDLLCFALHNAQACHTGTKDQQLLGCPTVALRQSISF